MNWFDVERIELLTITAWHDRDCYFPQTDYKCICGKTKLHKLLESLKIKYPKPLPTESLSND